MHVYPAIPLHLVLTTNRFLGMVLSGTGDPSPSMEYLGGSSHGSQLVVINGDYMIMVIIRIIPLNTWFSTGVVITHLQMLDKPTVGD